MKLEKQTKGYGTRVLKIPANGSVPVSGEGTSFYVVSTSAPFYLAPAIGAEVYVEGRTGVRSLNGEFYTGLNVRNPTGAEITATVFFGHGDYIDNRIV